MFSLVLVLGELTKYLLLSAELIKMHFLVCIILSKGILVDNPTDIYHLLNIFVFTLSFLLQFMQLQI